MQEVEILEKLQQMAASMELHSQQTVETTMKTREEMASLMRRFEPDESKEQEKG